MTTSSSEVCIANHLYRMDYYQWKFNQCFDVPLLQLDTFEPSIPAVSCNIPTSRHFDPLAAGLAVNLFDSVNNTSHILEEYRAGPIDIAAWINRTIPEQELQCELCELTCGISCDDNCVMM